MTDDECKAEFRFFRNDIYNLINVLRVPAELTCYNGLKVDAVEEMCIFLKRFAYPCRYADLIPRLAKPEPQLCMIANQMTSVIYDTWHHLLTTFEQTWLDPLNLEMFADVIHNKGAALSNC